MSHHFERLEEIKATRNKIKEDHSENAKSDRHRDKLIRSIPQDVMKPEMLGSSGSLGIIGSAGINLAKGLIQKFKGGFRTGAKEIAKDQTISTALDLFNK